MMNHIKKCLTSHYVKFSGRASRTEYWSFILPLSFLMFPVLFLDITLFSPSLSEYRPISSIFGVAVFLPVNAVWVRRLHDIGKGAVWLLIYYAVYITMVVIALVLIFNLIPLYAIIPGVVLLTINILFLVFACLPSQEGSNKYGESPH